MARKLKRVLRQGVVNLQIRLSEEQHRALSQCAGFHGLSTSAWARMILLREVKPKEK
jgi:plasmid stability protein